MGWKKSLDLIKGDKLKRKKIPKKYLGSCGQMLGHCVDERCPGYGKPLVDRGYGYPVCVTVPDIEEK